MNCSGIFAEHFYQMDMLYIFRVFELLALVVVVVVALFCRLFASCFETKSIISAVGYLHSADTVRFWFMDLVFRGYEKIYLHFIV